jgi:hypothetical protein
MLIHFIFEFEFSESDLKFIQTSRIKKSREVAQTIALEEDGGRDGPVVIRPNHRGGRLTPVLSPCPLSCWRSRCCVIPLWEILSVYGNDEFEGSPIHLCLYLVLYSNKRWKQNGLYWFKNQRALLYSNSNIFGFFRGKIQEPSSSPNQYKNWHERNLLGVLTYLPHNWSSHCWAMQHKCVEFKLSFVIVPLPRVTMVL